MNQPTDPTDESPADESTADEGPVETGTVETSTADESPVETSTVETSTVEAGAADESHAETGAVETSTVETSTAETDPVEASPVEASPAPTITPLALDSADSPHRSIPAGYVLFVGIIGLLLAIVFNSQVLLDEARQKPFGWARDLSQAVWEPVEAVSSAVGLHLPRLWLDEALNRDLSGRDAADRVTTGDDSAASGGAADGGASGAANGGGDSGTDDGTAGTDGSASPDGASPGGAGGSTSNGTDGGTGGGTAPDDSSTGDSNTGDSNTDSATGADGSASPDGNSPDGTNTDTATSSQLITPTPDDPLNMWVIGDSLTHFFGDEMVQIAEDTEVIEAETQSQISSGLSRPDYFDWPARITEILIEEDPDVVVLTLGGNDAQGLSVGENVFPTFTADWINEYSTRVGHVMDLVTADPTRLLIWGGIPIMRDDRFDSRMQQLNTIYAAEAQGRDRVIFVPSRELFSGPDGEYSRYLTDENGRRIDARLTDGIHFSAAGGALMSELLLEALGEYVDLESGVADTP